MSVLIVKEGNLTPDVQITVYDADGAVVDLTSATVLFTMVSASGLATATTITDGAVVLTDAANGVVTYIWQATDTDIPGKYLGEFHVTPNTGDPYNVPTSGYIDIEIEPTL